jgi:hypothetical protein
MCRTLLAHLQEALHRRCLVNYVRRMCVDYVQFAVELQPARNRLCSVACGMTVNDA